MVVLIGTAPGSADAVRARPTPKTRRPSPKAAGPIITGARPCVIDATRVAVIRPIVGLVSRVPARLGTTPWPFITGKTAALTRVIASPRARPGLGARGRPRTAYAGVIITNGRKRAGRVPVTRLPASAAVIGRPPPHEAVRAPPGRPRRLTRARSSGVRGGRLTAAGGVVPPVRVRSERTALREPCAPETVLADVVDVTGVPL